MSAVRVEHRDPTDAPTGPAGGTLFARRWDDDEPEARPEHPRPIVCARPLALDEIGPWGVPAAVRSLVRKVAPGWTVTVTVALGYRMLARRPWYPPEPSLSHVLRARGVIRVGGPVRGAVGVWTDGKFDHARAWTVCADLDCGTVPADHPIEIPGKLGATALRELLTMEPVG